MSSYIEVVFQPYGKRTLVPGGTTIIDAAKKLGIDISSLCGGKGTCGKCKVKVQEGLEGLNPLTEQELDYLSNDEIETDFRLACQAKLTLPSTILVPEMSRVGKQRLQTEGIEVPVELNPLVKKYFLQLPKPTLHDARSDEDRILDSLKDEHGRLGFLDFDIAKDLSIILREAEWAITAVMWGDKVIAIERGDTTGRCFGFAVDIGTTKLAGFLMDLNKGNVVDVVARANPQIPFGEDVMSRIAYAMNGGWTALNELQKAVVSGINEMIEECCKKAGLKYEEVYELCFVGNTCMQLLFLGIWPRHVAFSPYPPVLRRGVDTNASKLGLKSHVNANVHFLPIIGGFVGADSVADIMAVKMLESDETIMDIDIGTNTEIAIGNKKSAMIDSCASGPAFEGMEIKFGMRAVGGAIEKVSIAPKTLEVNYRTINDVAPIGVCGSGLIDTLAELLKSGLIDVKGTFVKEMTKRTNRLRQGQNGWEFALAWRTETGTNADLSITQGDIRELQKAKAAMHAGCEILMKRMNLTENDIDKLYMAGAFGNYIDPESARTIGIYPEISIEKIHFVGNTAGTGARMCLASKEMRERAEEISKRVKYFELAADPEFQSEYINSTYLPHVNLNKYPITKRLLERLGKSRL
ncbi:MAG TPA: ASKHA domain-containing protein [Candidatus Bathyarchaeia archaeon]|nr:ASKHA domain-containing protein [Candidatus Bathyarchaeia archaeon]